MEVVISPRAISDIADIFAWTSQNFGPQTMRRYGKLIATAIEEIAIDPVRAGSVARPEIAVGCRTYHLYFSRKTAGRRAGGIRNPRHLLVYRVREADVVEIGRVLHDSMELREHIPEEYRDHSD